MKHLSQQTLVMLLDDELSPTEAARAEAHMETCLDCTQQYNALRAVMHLHAAAEPPQHREAARASLIHRLQDQRQPRHYTWLRPRILLQTAMVVLLLTLGFAFRHAYQPLQDSMAAYEETGPKPNRSITPGAVRPAELSELCAMADDDLDPTVAPEKQRAVFASYGLNERQARAYQVDYLINPQLGGNDSIENLWPEPYHATVWNAEAKDALEARLHGMVCNGQMDLTQAQQDIATDWIGAYKRVFHASRPVRVQASSR